MKTEKILSFYRVALAVLFLSAIPGVSGMAVAGAETSTVLGKIMLSGCLATLMVTGAHDFTNLISNGSIRIGGIAQSNFGAFKVSGNTLSLVTSGSKPALSR